MSDCYCWVSISSYNPSQHMHWSTHDDKWLTPHTVQKKREKRDWNLDPHFCVCACDWLDWLECIIYCPGNCQHRRLMKPQQIRGVRAESRQNESLWSNLRALWLLNKLDGWWNLAGLYLCLRLYSRASYVSSAYKVPQWNRRILRALYLSHVNN